MAPVPTAYDATAFKKLTAVDLDNGVRDPLNYYLGDYPRVHAYQSGNLPCLNGVAKLITFDSEVYDNDNMHSVASLTSRIVFNTPGLYRHTIKVHMATATFTTLNMAIVKNGAGLVGGGVTLVNPDFKSTASGPGNCFLVFNWPYTVAGDYIEVFITQSTAASVNTAAGALATFVQADWIASS
jgi:hypothetical protein